MTASSVHWQIFFDVEFVQGHQYSLCIPVGEAGR